MQELRALNQPNAQIAPAKLIKSRANRTTLLDHSIHRLISKTSYLDSH